MNEWNEYLELNYKIVSAPDLGSKLNLLSDQIMELVQEKSGILFTAGNGGSATTADHFAADLSLTNKRVGEKIRASCLNSHLGLNSALANDIHYADALSEQLKNYESDCHLLISFSASGNSSNLINLHNTASKMGIQSWSFLGFDGGEILKIDKVNTVLFPDSLKNYGIVENIHLMACHYMVERINGMLGNKR